MKNREEVISILTGGRRPKDAMLASLMLTILDETREEDANIQTVVTALDNLCRDEMKPMDTFTLTCALGVALPGSMADILNHGSDRSSRLKWDEFAVGCFWALGELDRRKKYGKFEGLPAEAKRQIEEALAKLLANRFLEKTGGGQSSLETKLSGILANAMPLFVEGYDGLHVLKVVSSLVKTWRPSDETRIPTSQTIVAEMSRKVFGSRTLKGQIETLLQ